MSDVRLPAFRAVLHPASPSPGEAAAATELARFAGLTPSAAAAPGGGLAVALASRGWYSAARLPAAAAGQSGWIWLRCAEDGTGEIVATHGAFLFSAVRLLARGIGDFTRERLAAGIYLPA